MRIAVLCRRPFRIPLGLAGAFQWQPIIAGDVGLGGYPYNFMWIYNTPNVSELYHPKECKAKRD